MKPVLARATLRTYTLSRRRTSPLLRLRVVHYVTDSFALGPSAVN
jgi:hypothetical protein